MRRARLGLPAAIAVVLACAGTTSGPAAAKSGASAAVPGGVVGPGGFYRYTALSPQGPGESFTVVTQAERRTGLVDRWWHMGGVYQVPAMSYDGSAAGISRDGGTLVLSRFSRVYPPRHTGFAILDLQRTMGYRLSAESPAPRQAVDRVELPGSYTFHAISPDGERVYVSEHLSPTVGGPARIRVLDTDRGGLRPLGAVASPGSGRLLRGVPLRRQTSPDGRWSYTLYSGYSIGRDRVARAGRTFVHGLDTLTGFTSRVELRRLPRGQNPFMLAMALRGEGRRLAVLNRDEALEGSHPIQVVDTGRFGPRPDAGGILAWPHFDRLEAVKPPQRHPGFLGFAFTPRRPGNLVMRQGAAGRSAQGRRIGLRQYGDPALEGEVLVFGCVHGDECAAAEIRPMVPGSGCPDTASDVYFVPNLDPDGLALGTRLNGRGVDLNRNFPASWRPIGERGDPQHSGSAPFSEPETRLAARIVRRVGPEVTIWFHQYRKPRRLVRAWGPSVPAARQFARLAKIPFRRLPWPDGTAPNWQNHAFPGTASFVVELPPGPLSRNAEFNLGGAIVRLARKVSED